MRHLISGSLSKEISVLFNELGYYFHEVKEGVFSFKRIIHERPFPRFHIYVRKYENGLELDLHIDQEHPNRLGNHEKEWAYQGPIVKRELKRIDAIIERHKSGHVLLELKPRKKFWEILTSR